MKKPRTNKNEKISGLAVVKALITQFEQMRKQQFSLQPGRIYFPLGKKLRAALDDFQNRHGTTLSGISRFPSAKGS